MANKYNSQALNKQVIFFYVYIMFILYVLCPFLSAVTYFSFVESTLLM
jgi:hypothetical protein